MARSLRPLVVLLVVSLAAFPATAGSAAVMTANQQTIDAATFTANTPPAADAPRGVSPEVFYDAPTRTYYLLTTGVPAVQYTSSDGITWTATSTVLPRGIDWSIVQEGPGSYRLYYAEMVPGPSGSAPPPCTAGSKILRYATSTDLRAWTAQPGVLLDDVGCGVPHVMKTSAGKYFLYFNKVDGQHGVFIATSSDGLRWGTPVGPLNNDTELVDPAPLELPDGTFVMVASSMGRGSFQYLQLLASQDGLTWVKRKSPLFAPSGAGAFDPSVELVDGQLRVWFGYSPAGVHADAQIAHGRLELGGAGPAAELSATCTKLRSARAPTITCSGRSVAIDPGSTVTPHVKLGRKGGWKTIASGAPTIDPKGDFTWRYRTGSATSIAVYFTVGETRTQEIRINLR